MKVCTKCMEEKGLSDFFVKDRKAGRLHSQCKDCYKEHRKAFYAEHYEKYKLLYQKRAKIRRETLRTEFRENIIHYLKDKSCTICGESDIRTLEFDHLNPSEKLFNISQSVRLGYGWPKIVAELKKCRILCANCHKKHTAIQANWYKNI